METKRKAPDGAATPTRRKGGRPPDGPILDVRNGALDTQSNLIISRMNHLSYGDADSMEDQNVDVAAAFVQVIANTSTDPESRRGARHALVALRQSRIWDGLADQSVEDAENANGRAKVSNTGVIHTAEAALFGAREA